MVIDATDGVFDFEGIDESLPYVPIAARRALDTLGRKLSLEGWLSLPVDRRRALARAGAAHRVDPDVARVIDEAAPRSHSIPVAGDPDPEAPPQSLVQALGTARPLAAAVWAALHPLGRYALVKSEAKPDKLARAYDEIVARPRAARLTHLTDAGAAHMVDIAAKSVGARRAVASARVHTSPSVLGAVRGAAVAKGDVLAAARIAGILAAKRTPELIPLCHPVATTHAAVDFEVDVDRGELRIRTTVEALDRTGVEMEALVAASVAALTVYDMIKSADRWARIEAVQLESKSGGKSGDVSRRAGGDSPGDSRGDPR
jgi:cyclic pyranopterin phosphate synthase